jgi:hypothetical protein
MTREVYHSSTHGNIPLSFEGRRLLQNLRLAIMAYGEACKNAKPNEFIDWQPVARARGDIAAYFSKLETRAGHPFDESEAPKPRPTLPLRIPLPSHSASIVLPPIPPGYELTMVGNVVSISPVEPDKRL